MCQNVTFLFFFMLYYQTVIDMTEEALKRQLILKDPNIYKGLIILALPIMLNNLLKTLHDVVDMFFVARIPGVSAEAVSAIQITFPVMFTYLSLGLGISVAGTALISQLLGANKLDDAHRFAGQVFTLAVTLGLFLSVLSYLIAPSIVSAMGATGFVFENSVAYLRIRAFELPYLFMFFALMATRNASGDTVSPMKISVTSVILNTLLSPLFIIVFGWGVPGAALATLMGYLIVMPWAIKRLFFAPDGVRILPKYLSLNPLISIKIIKTAVPASMGQAITAIGFGLMNGIIFSYGVNTVAAFGIGNRITSMILHPAMAIGGVMSAFIGQNIGARNPERAKLVFKKALILSSGTMAIGSLIVLFIREPLISLFIQDNPEALALSVDYMFYILIGLPLMGVFQAFMGTYNGTGYTHYSFVLSVLRLWGLRIPLVLLMNRFTTLGSSGIWYAILISNLIIAVVGYGLYKRISFEPKVDVEPRIPVQTVLKPSS